MERVLFWEDKWVDEKPLKEAFPRLYSNSNQKMQKLDQVGDWKDLEWVWNLRWRRE